MGLDLRLQHKMSQQLVMTPQLQQAIKLLQLSHLEMAQALQQELAQNPVLEELDVEAGISEREAHLEAHEEAHEEAHQDAIEAALAPAGASSTASTADTSATAFEPPAEPWPRGKGESGQQMPPWESTHVVAASLQGHLRWQVNMARLTPCARAAAHYLVEEVNEDGYLPADVVQSCALALEVAQAQVQAALTALQECDPVGVGARSLRECLALQARQLQPPSALMLAIIEGHLHDIEGRHFGRIARALRVRPAQVSEAVRQLAKLTPRPGRAFAAAAPHYIVPDLYVVRAGGTQGGFDVAVNEEGLPRLGISPYYGDAKVHTFTGTTRTYVQEKLRAATWLLRSVHMRQRTMVRVMRSILSFQADFFEDGQSPLRPLVLREVAQDLDMHESTISRVTANKYVHTPHGIFELKFFFNSTIRGTKGEEVASESVRQKISRFIDRENKTEPLSDQKIVDLLRGHDISIARRTVAKYRKMLNKQPSSVRRRDF